MYRLKIFLKTLSPIVLTSASNSTVMTETHISFSGAIIRGIFASRFVEVHKLTDEAHDKNFRKLFFGDLKFLPANPEILNKRSFVLPLSLQSGKSGTSDENKVQDLLADENPGRGYKSFRGFGIEDNGKFFTAKVKTNIFMHMSRSSDAERLSGKSEDGGIYNYEAIDNGQTFCGEIIGDEETLNELREGLNLDGGKMIAYVGRSKFTQYGKCLVTFGNVEEIPVKNFSDKIYLRLDTPLIPVDDCFISAEKILTEEIANKLGENFSIGKVFASGIEVENFVVPWSMKRPRLSALAAGTVFELKISAPLTDTDKNFLHEKIYTGFGIRTEEGFGQLRIWQPSTDFTKGEQTNDDKKISKPEKFSDDTLTLAKKILLARLLEQVRLFAYKDARDLESKLKLGNFTHFFTRLGGIFSSIGKENIRENFKLRLEQEIRSGSQFEEHLENFYMSNDQKMSKVFTGNAEFPRNRDEILNSKEFAEVCAAINFKAEDFSDDTFLFEYLTNYLRFARKLAAEVVNRE